MPVLCKLNYLDYSVGARADVWTFESDDEMLKLLVATRRRKMLCRALRALKPK